MKQLSCPESKILGPHIPQLFIVKKGPRLMGQW